jgi:hypothetical protein
MHFTSTYVFCIAESYQTDKKYVTHFAKEYDKTHWVFSHELLGASSNATVTANTLGHADRSSLTT